MLEQWMQYFIALFKTLIEFLGSCRIFGASILSINIAAFIIIVVIRSLIYKP